MTTERLGLLAYLENGVVHTMGVRPLTEPEAIKYIAAKMLAKEYELERNDNPAPPAYWVPIDAFVPMEQTLAEPLKQESFRVIRDSIDEAIHQDCNDDDCPLHGSSQAAMEAREAIKQSPIGYEALRRMGLID